MDKRAELIRDHLADKDLRGAQQLESWLLAELKKFPVVPEDVGSVRELNGRRILPFAFGSCRVEGGLHPWELFRRPTKQEVWDIMQDLPEGERAVVFNTDRHGKWAMHTALRRPGDQESTGALRAMWVCMGNRGEYMIEKWTNLRAHLHTLMRR